MILPTTKAIEVTLGELLKKNAEFDFRGKKETFTVASWFEAQFEDVLVKRKDNAKVFDVATQTMQELKLPSYIFSVDSNWEESEEIESGSSAYEGLYQLKNGENKGKYVGLNNVAIRKIFPFAIITNDYYLTNAASIFLTKKFRKVGTEIFNVKSSTQNIDENIEIGIRVQWETGRPFWSPVAFNTTPTASHKFFGLSAQIQVELDFPMLGEELIEAPTTFTLEKI